MLLQKDQANHKPSKFILKYQYRYWKNLDRPADPFPPFDRKKNQKKKLLITSTTNCHLIQCPFSRMRCYANSSKIQAETISIGWYISCGIARNGTSCRWWCFAVVLWLEKRWIIQCHLSKVFKFSWGILLYIQLFLMDMRFLPKMQLIKNELESCHRTLI